MQLFLQYVYENGNFQNIVPKKTVNQDFVLKIQFRKQIFPNPMEKYVLYLAHFSIAFEKLH